MMLQVEQPAGYVIATGEPHTVPEFLDRAFVHVGLDWHEYVKIDPRYYRPTEVDLLIGDASKAKRTLGWEPKVSFEQLVTMMVDADVRAERQTLEGTKGATLEASS